MRNLFARITELASEAQQFDALARQRALWKAAWFYGPFQLSRVTIMELSQQVHMIESPIEPFLLRHLLCVRIMVVMK